MGQDEVRRARRARTMAEARRPGSLERVIGELDRWGLLLEQDPVLPSVVATVVGHPVKGSWWGHVRGAEIFQVLQALADRDDVLSAKLVSRKVTFVHRRLWPALLAIGRAGERWQQAGLSSQARALLARIRRSGELRTDEAAAAATRPAGISPPASPARGRGRRASREISAAARELEIALLVSSTQVHTESGTHARLLSTWERWARQHPCGPPLSLSEGKARIEAVVDAWARAAGARASLPWPG
jgi:hypothetical protein